MRSAAAKLASGFDDIHFPFDFRMDVTPEHVAQALGLSEAQAEEVRSSTRR